MKTVVRRSLIADSQLQSRVKDGLQALKSVDRVRVAVDIRTRFEDSIDIDAAFEAANPTDNRWDYLLGDKPTGRMIGVEPHSAKSDEVSTVIAKKDRAREHLRPHLRKGCQVFEWFWVSSGTVHFPDMDRTEKRLAQANITFVGRQLKKGDLKRLDAGL